MAARSTCAAAEGAQSSGSLVSRRLKKWEAEFFLDFKRGLAETSHVEDCTVAIRISLGGGPL